MKERAVRKVKKQPRQLQAILQKSRQQIEETGGIPHDQFWGDVEAENRKATANTGNGKRGRTKR